MKIKSNHKTISFTYLRDLKGNKLHYQWMTILNKLWKVNRLTKIIIIKNNWLKKAKPISEKKWEQRYLPIEMIRKIIISSWASKWLMGLSLQVYIVIIWKRAFKIQIAQIINIKGIKVDSQVNQGRIRYRHIEIPIRVVTFYNKNSLLTLKFLLAKISSLFFKFRLLTCNR